MMSTPTRTQFETLKTHVKKLEMHVVQIGEAIKRQEALVKGKGEETLKHHVDALPS